LLALDETAKDLSTFGLTGSQAKVYIALVQLGVASVSETARLSKVRREEVYRMMPKLEKLGLVEKVLGKPIKYKPIPPEEGLCLLLRRQQEAASRKITELAEKKTQLLGQLESLKNKRVLDEPEILFVLISDRVRTVHMMIEMTNNAVKEVVFTATQDGIREWMGLNYDDALKRAVKRGVKVRILVDIDEVDVLIPEIFKGFNLYGNTVEMRHVDHVISRLMIVDDKEALVGIPITSWMEGHVYLWTNSTEYTRELKRLFNMLWGNSVDAKLRMSTETLKLLKSFLSSLSSDTFSHVT
jgi:sugar-specific transcriptional regulator TrmB